MSKRLFVGGLPFSTTENELRDLFTKYGAVVACQIIIDRQTGRSKGFGFVEMENDEEAEAAIKGLDGSELGDRKIAVNVARPKEERSDGGGYRGGGRSFDRRNDRGNDRRGGGRRGY